MLYHELGGTGNERNIGKSSIVNDIVDHTIYKYILRAIICIFI